jgi:uncharacterized protein YjbI with pentapeptide repeats
MAETREKLDPFDVTALERSLNDSATRVSTIWVSFLIFALYLVIAAGTVTHRQLLLEDPVKLPVLNIDLPLYGFFFLAPILFVILHVYVLLQVLLLGRTAAAYNEAVDKAVKPPLENASVRQRLANTLFAQIFAGSPRERGGPLGALLKAMAWVTIAIAPVLLLFVFQFKFLPYHSHFVTWTHRLLIFMELATVFMLWPLVLDAQMDIAWRRIVRQPITLATVALFAVVSLCLATFPGEPLVNLFTGQSLLSVQCERWISENFDRLLLQREVIVDEEKLKKIENATTKSHVGLLEMETTRNFRNRDLNCGHFEMADLRRADFFGARMSDASFFEADLQGASFFAAHLPGAGLSLAQLQGANLFVADLQGATLNNTKLQGANLQAANLQGADLPLARLEGADLTEAHLEGASLFLAQLQGANLSKARLQGANLPSVRLWGANLDKAELQGANFENGQLELSLLNGVFVWRTKGANCADALTTNSQHDPIIETRFDSSGREADEPISATPEAIERFIERAVANLRGQRKDDVRESLRASLISDIPKDDLAAFEATWRECATNSAKIERAGYERRHSDFLRNLVCNAAEHRKEIAAGIIRNWISDSLIIGDDYFSSLARELARGLLGLDGKDCPATKELRDEVKDYLRERASTP